VKEVRKRVSDDAIYLKEERHAEPKELFKKLSYIISEFVEVEDGLCMLDVGCASGELIYYLETQFPNANYYGIDVSDDMLNLAKRKIGFAKLNNQSILELPLWVDIQFDVILCLGVVGIFDEIEVTLSNLISSLKDGGRLLLSEQFNDDSVDVIMRYRRVDSDDNDWESGWNIFSMKTIEDIAKRYDKKVKWHEFRMPFGIEKSEDPMRTWTIETEANKHQLIVGSKQLIDLYVAEIY
jgi:SAM-dependent methyltransferase